VDSQGQRDTPVFETIDLGYEDRFKSKCPTKVGCFFSPFETIPKCPPKVGLPGYECGMVLVSILT
jgi:hypothetical protein